MFSLNKSRYEDLGLHSFKQLILEEKIQLVCLALYFVM